MRDNVRVYKKKNNPIWYGWYFVEGRRINFCTKCTDRRAAILAVKHRERQTFTPGGSTENEASHTIQEALTFLLAHSSSDCARATLQMYAVKSGHLLRLIGNIQVGKLKLDDIQSYINQRQAEGAKNNTIYKELVTLRKSLTIARGRNLYPSDPRIIFPSFSNEYVPKRRHLAFEEVGFLLANIAAHRQLDVLVMVYLGPRLSEAYSLKWQDVNFDKGWVAITGTKTTKANRMVPLPPVMLELLKQHRQRQGTVLAPWNNIRRDLELACKKAGIARVTPNDLRRTFASWLKQPHGRTRLRAPQRHRLRERRQGAPSAAHGPKTG